MLITQAVASRELVTAASPAARARGVRPGMPLADARALLPGEPLVASAEPEKDLAALHALARWATRWTPLSQPDPPDGLLLDVTGCTHLFGGEGAMLAGLSAALARLGVAARIGSAGTVGAAWAAARFMGPSNGPINPGAAAVARVEPGGERDALGPMPIEALRLEPAAATGLREVGLARVEQVLALPRAGLPARYGAGLLRRVDQALGLIEENVGSLPEAKAYRAWFDLPGGTKHLEALQLAVERALSDLCTAMARDEVGLRRLTATFTRIDAEELALTVHVSRPTRDADHLARLLRPRVERVNLGFGVEGVTLAAGETAPLPFEQGLLVRRAGWGSGTLVGARPADDAAFAHALDAIVNRLGPERVFTAALRESYRPERVSVLTPLGQERPARRGPAPRALDRPRPSRLLEKPVPIRVMALSPDGPVVAVSGLGAGEAAGAGIAGGEGAVDGLEITRPVRASIGPERVGGEWWKAREGARDYFRVQEDSGRWLWIFREAAPGGGAGTPGEGRWFLHGEWA